MITHLESRLRDLNETALTKILASLDGSQHIVVGDWVKIIEGKKCGCLMTNSYVSHLGPGHDYSYFLARHYGLWLEHLEGEYANSNAIEAAAAAFDSWARRTPTYIDRIGGEKVLSPSGRKRVRVIVQSALDYLVGESMVTQ